MLFPPPFMLPISYFTYCFKHPIVFLALHFLLHISCLSLPAPHMLLSHFRAYTSCFKHPMITFLAYTPASNPMITFPGLHFLLQTPYDHISWPTLPASNILSSHFLAYTSCFTFPVFCFLLHISWPTLPASHFLSFASCFVHAMLDRKLDNRKCEEENIEKEVRNRNFCLCLVLVFWRAWRANEGKLWGFLQSAHWSGQLLQRAAAEQQEVPEPHESMLRFYVANLC